METNTPNTSAMHQTMIVVWYALLFSQFLFVGMVFFVKPEMFRLDFSVPVVGDGIMIVAVFALLSLTLFAASFFLRKKYLEQSIAEQKVAIVQTAMILGCAMCETIGLLGMLLAFIFSYQYFWLFSALGIFGTLLHFPRKGDIMNATYRTGT